MEQTLDITHDAHSANPGRNARRERAVNASARVTLALGLGLALLPASARANPHPLPYSYPYQTLPKGKIEVEEIADLIPMLVAREK